MIVVLLAAVWLVGPPVLGYLIGRWWALAFSLTCFPAFILWVWLRPATGTSIAGEPAFEVWFSALVLFLFLTLPPLGLSAVAIAWRRWA